MARKVKCNVTGEYGTSDTFIKIDNKYYKDRETYENNRKEKDLWHELINYICINLLNYEKGQPFPSLVTRKLNEFSFYNREVILQSFKEKEKDILYQINQDCKFDNEQSKIFYMFAIVKNNINDVNKKWKRKQLTEVKQQKSEINIETNIEELGTSKKGKDISGWLEDDEI